MFTIHPGDARVLAQDHARRLREDAAAAPGHGASAARRALAASLRCAARRLDPPALAPRIA